MSDVAGGIGWVIAVNLILWSGIFLYLLRLHARLTAAERGRDEAGSEP